MTNVIKVPHSGIGKYLITKEREESRIWFLKCNVFRGRGASFVFGISCVYVATPGIPGKSPSPFCTISLIVRRNVGTTATEREQCRLLWTLYQPTGISNILICLNFLRPQIIIIHHKINEIISKKVIFTYFLLYFLFFSIFKIYFINVLFSHVFNFKCFINKVLFGWMLIKFWRQIKFHQRKKFNSVVKKAVTKLFDWLMF